jgi:hypothetical protein
LSFQENQYGFEQKKSYARAKGSNMARFGAAAVQRDLAGR